MFIWNSLEFLRGARGICWPICLLCKELFHGLACPCPSTRCSYRRLCVQPGRGNHYVKDFRRHGRQQRQVKREQDKESTKRRTRYFFGACCSYSVVCCLMSHMSWHRDVITTATAPCMEVYLVSAVSVKAWQPDHSAVRLF